MTIGKTLAQQTALQQASETLCSTGVQTLTPDQYKTLYDDLSKSNSCGTAISPDYYKDAPAPRTE